jgi:monoamine oxidase
LKNVLMDDPRYLRLYSIEGGIARLIDGLAERIGCRVFLECPVVRVGRHGSGYRLTTRRQGQVHEHDFDHVVLALPNYWLQRLDWGSRELRHAMQQHLRHYDRPAHYLRMTLLFKEPFWRKHIPGSYFITDAFNGCCVYDEGARHPVEPYGVLGWLVAGNDALALSNADDATLIAQALDSLPAPLAHGRELLLEAACTAGSARSARCRAAIRSTKPWRGTYPSPRSIRVSISSAITSSTRPSTASTTLRTSSRTS